jgi:glycosyltransferase involved in cell wall biosynthesis
MKACLLSSVHIALDNRLFYREARSLVKAGYDVTLIAVHPATEVRQGVKIIGLPQVPRWQRPRLWLQLLRLALAEQADLYHFHDPELLLVTPWLRLLTGRPTVYDVHEVYTDFIQVKDYMPAWLRYPIAWVFRWLEPLLARLQSGLIFSDDEIAKTFAHLRKPKTTLFNFPARFFIERAITETKEIADRPPVVLHLGGHERNRGTRLMIAAFAQVLEVMPEARLTLVGHFMPPELQAEVQADVQARGLQGAVTITGRVPFERIGDYLKRAAVGWVPWQPYPKNEKNIPTKLFEYMAYGLPIVASDLASTRPFVRNGENGYLVRASDPSAHAQAILHLLQNPQLGQEMGKHGQELVHTRYHWGAMEERLLAFYRRLLSDSMGAIE